MTNKDIANAFASLAKIMELHGENPFRIRSYNSVYLTLRKLETPVSEMTEAEMVKLKGVGKGAVGRIAELLESGTMTIYQEYLSKTPPGVVDMLKVNGFGPKKVKTVWETLKVETIGELLYACNENRLVEVKGFGAKTQADLIKKLELFLQSKNKFIYAKLLPVQEEILQHLIAKLPAAQVSVVGAMRRLDPIVETIDFLVSASEGIETVFDNETLFLGKEEAQFYSGKSANGVPIRLFFCKDTEWGSKLFRYTGTAEFMDAFLAKTSEKSFTGIETEEAVFEKAGLSYLLPELRNEASIFERNIPEELITESDIQGVIHSHTTYSDGIHTLKEMVEEARRLGYGYIGITDHSQAAFYANGLKPERLMDQFAEIDQLNEQYDDFTILKGIESDILSDGKLDYEEDILKQFDFIIASVHSNLKMDEEKANKRLIAAIENPYTSILGHPTGRILLARAGYPIDHKKIIDACAANGVHIELNANPLRLDLDWTWIHYAISKNVLISINPDAHSKGGIQDIQYGVNVARKGLLTKEMCLNSRNVEAFMELCGK